jgi:dienelactone hydrolase
MRKSNVSMSSFVFSILPLLIAGCAFRSSHRPFPEYSVLPSHRQLPDALTTLDGVPVTSREQWFNQRRPELKALFEHYMYGPIPPKPRQMQARIVGEYDNFLDGKATLKLVRLETGPGNGPGIDLMIVLPHAPTTPAPVFLAMDFCGNHALTADTRVPLARSWMAKTCAGCTNNSATEAARGSQATNWPLAEIVRRGYALAAFYSGDIDSDRPDASTGLYAWLAGGDAAKNSPTNRGTIAAWAWGFERCVDYLVTDAALDRRHIAAVGHSRNGKTTLLAAAFDERIALAFPHQAGCGGSAPSRGTNGESVKAINERFPYWFNAEFKKFNREPEKLPFDQNCLVALCAPRAVLFTGATQDQWSNPAGQLEVLEAADPVYRFLGTDGLGHHANPPALGTLYGSRLGYYIREGKHSMTPGDWTVFMDFADRQWSKLQ